MARTVVIRLFAGARQAVGSATLPWPVPREGIRARELVSELAKTYPALGPILRASRFLRNDRYLLDLDEKIEAGDEFAIHPPYGGG